MNQGGDADNWPEIEALLKAAIELPSAEQADYLRRNCKDTAQRERVQALLAAVRMDTGLVLGSPGSGGQSEAKEWLFAGGEEVGPYTLIEPLGRGGMGEVWRARLTDGAILRDVALKLPYIAMIGAKGRDGLRHERDLLATLNHPHIAQLHDAGVLDSDQPYLALELVDGAPITQWCDAHTLDVQARLRLFLQVVDAVRYAHSRLIVHRDLKPANILVTQSGDAKLLDFGVAKLLDTQAADGQAQATLRAVTPEYAAPEQLSGGALTTATDIYALGVVLFELLTGRRPFASDARSGVWRAANTGLDAPRASASVTSDAPARMGVVGTRPVARALRGDLDAVIAQALAPDPEQRYLSAEHLARDIRAVLNGLPVEARRSGFVERLGKFARRNPMASTLGAIALIAVLGGTVAVNWQAQKTAHAADAALRASARANAVTEFLVEDLLAQADPRLSGSGDARVRDVAEVAAASVGDRFADEPDIAAQIHWTLARVFFALNAYALSLEHANQAIGRLTQAGDIDPETRAMLEILVGRSLRELGDEAQLQAWLSAHAPLVGAGLVADDSRRLWVPALEVTTYTAREDFAEAVSQLSPAFERLMLLPDADPDLVETIGEWLALAHSYVGEMQLALQVADRRWRYQIDRWGETHARTLEAELLVVAALRETGEHEQAIERAQGLIPAVDAALGPDHFSALRARFILARSLVYAGRNEEAVAPARRAFEGMSAVLGPEHDETLTSANLLAVIYTRTRQYAAAALMHRLVRDAYVDRFGPVHPHALTYRANAARAEGDLGDFDTALPELGQILTDAETVFTEADFQLGVLYGISGEIHDKAGEKAQARELLLRGEAILVQTLGETHAQTQRIRQTLADLGAG